MKKIFLCIILFSLSFLQTFAVDVSHNIDKTWDGWHCGNIEINNSSYEDIYNWELYFNISTPITSFWNADYTNQNDTYTVTWIDWNEPLDAQQSFSIWYCSDGGDIPENIRFISGEKQINKNTFLEPLEIWEPIEKIETIWEYAPPFFARNGKLYDSKNTLVQLRGVNWFWFAWDSRIPWGLWERNYKDIASQIKETWFNSIRLPFCPATLRSQISNSYSRSNPELVWKNSLELMDIFITHLASEWMYLLLDMHTSDCTDITDTPFIDGYDYDMWKSDWQFVANRYKNIENVIAVDPKNEPHGDAVWNDETNNFDVNRKLQVEEIWADILKINPNLLVFVNGIEKNHKWWSDIMDCELDLSQSWWWNINPIDCYPIDENKIPAEKMILSPHIYWPSVYPRDYFEDENFPENMNQIWEKTFWKYAEKYTLIFGEFGWNYLAEDKIWQDALISYMISKRIDSFYFWSWNPNSTDTKWLVLDDWKTLETPKYNNLSRLFFQNRNIEKTQTVEEQIIPENMSEDIIDGWNILEAQENPEDSEIKIQQDNWAENTTKETTDKIKKEAKDTSSWGVANNDKISDYFKEKSKNNTDEQASEVYIENQEKSDSSVVISLEDNDEKSLTIVQKEEKKWWEKILDFFKKLFENIKLFFNE
mgnify:CR=1 FL=1